MNRFDFLKDLFTKDYYGKNSIKINICSEDFRKIDKNLLDYLINQNILDRKGVSESIECEACGSGNLNSFENDLYKCGECYNIEKINDDRFSFYEINNKNILNLLLNYFENFSKDIPELSWVKIKKNIELSDGIVNFANDYDLKIKYYFLYKNTKRPSDEKNGCIYFTTLPDFQNEKDSSNQFISIQDFIEINLENKIFIDPDKFKMLVFSSISKIFRSFGFKNKAADFLSLYEKINKNKLPRNEFNVYLKNETGAATDHVEKLWIKNHKK